MSNTYAILYFNTISAYSQEQKFQYHVTCNDTTLV